uniref:Uncharacterized protein n=1 Tax=Acrobeloides nanus TaxID=290746 RepID=A0A914DTL9_9BILA
MKIIAILLVVIVLMYSMVAIQAINVLCCNCNTTLFGKERDKQCLADCMTMPPIGIYKNGFCAGKSNTDCYCTD